MLLKKKIDLFTIHFVKHQKYSNYTTITVKKRNVWTTIYMKSGMCTMSYMFLNGHWSSRGFSSKILIFSKPIFSIPHHLICDSIADYEALGIPFEYGMLSIALVYIRKLATKQVSLFRWIVFCEG